MVINKISINNSITNTKVSEVDFNEMSTILVGVSGSGKTTIINSIEEIIDIAKGQSIRGLEWRIEISDIQNKKIVWSGRFSDEEVVDDNEQPVVELINEELSIDGNTVILKENDSIIYKEANLPKLDKYKSVFYTLRDDDSLYDLHREVTSILIIGNNSFEYTQTNMLRTIPDSLEKYIEEVHSDYLQDDDTEKKIDSFTKILSLVSLDCRRRIYFVKKYDEDQFNYFNFVFSNIFPSVKEIAPTFLENTEIENADNEKKFLVIRLRMLDGSLVEQSRISSGMFKVLTLLAEVMFGNIMAPIIIDEIENSLGVNCLSDILDELETCNRQVIVTSHHPKIINSMPPQNWKIVSRNGNKVLTTAADDIIRSTSNHDAFIQLINNKLFNSEV